MGIIAGVNVGAGDLAKTKLLKVPFYTSLFYTVNTLMFGLGLMDSMLVPLLGTPIDKVVIVTDPICDALFCGYAVVNLCVALFVYPRGTSAEIKTQQQIFALYSFGFLPVMVQMYFAGMMGVMGVGQYVVMNSVFGGIALYNIAKL